MPECLEEFRGCIGKFKRVYISHEGNIPLRHSRARKSLDYVAFNSPCHRADESFRGRWRVSRTYLQYLSYQRRVVWNPVSHNNPATGSSYTDHLIGNIVGSRSKHCAKNAHD